jgi:hypothetical protein
MWEIAVNAQKNEAHNSGFVKRMKVVVESLIDLTSPDAQMKVVQNKHGFVRQRIVLHSILQAQNVNFVMGVVHPLIQGYVIKKTIVILTACSGRCILPIIKI